MTLKQRIRIIVVASSLLLLVCIETGWADKDPVLDDDGNVITEVDIKEYMGKGYRTGCIIGGAGLAVVPALYGGFHLADYFCSWDNEDFEFEKDGGLSLFFAGSVVIEVAVIIASYYTGKILTEAEPSSALEPSTDNRKSMPLANKKCQMSFVFNCSRSHSNRIFIEPF